MIPYFIFVVFVILFYWVEKPKLLLFTIIAFAVLRYNTGWDYGMYIHMVETPSFWNNPETSRYSLFWRVLFELSNKLNAPPLVIDVANILTYGVLYFSLDILKLTRAQKVQVLLVYALWYEFYLTSFSIIRQALSMAVGILMFSLIQRQKYLLSILVYLLAIHIHTSAAILILLYPIYFLKNKLNFKWLCISVIVMVGVLISLESVLGALADVGLGKYKTYLKWQDNFGGKLIYLNSILAIYFIIVFYFRHNISSMLRQCYFMVISGVFGGIAIYATGGSIVFTRMLSYFTIFLVFIMFPSVEIYREKRFFRFLLTVLLLLMFGVYLNIVSKGGGGTLTPYVPYKCILFD